MTNINKKIILIFVKLLIIKLLYIIIISNKILIGLDVFSISMIFIIKKKNGKK